MNQMQPDNHSPKTASQIEPLEHPVDPAKRFSWKRMAVGLIAGFFLGAVFNLLFRPLEQFNVEEYFGLYSYRYNILISSLLAGAIGSLLCGILCGFAGGKRIYTLTGNHILSGQLWGMLIGLALGVISLSAAVMVVGIVLGAIIGPVAGIIYSIAKKMKANESKTDF